MTRPFAATLAVLLVLVFVPTGGTPAPVPPPPKVDAPSELALLAGSWEIVSTTREGKETNYPAGKGMVVTFGKDGNWKSDYGYGRMNRIDPAKRPKEIDWDISRSDYIIVLKLIYTLDADTFVTCSTPSCSPKRPTEFKSTEENDCILTVYKRVTK